MANDTYHNKKKSRTSRWLVIGVIILAVLLVLWLTIFEYWGAVEQGDVDRAGEQIENTVSTVTTTD
ncbi:MAG: hypothetical protein NC117_04610 [Pseudoflavonifractor sp.]|nr:hypothetical protein [Pseudoflavonifractor sp.]